MVASSPVYPGMRKNSVLAVLCGIVAMTVLDLSVVNVALPSIQRDLNVGSSDLQWVVVAYGVAVAGFLLVGGRLGDLLGHRRVLVIGVGVLMVASFAGGVSGTFGLLVAARAGQGLGAALAAPNALGILSRTFAEGPERNRALGILGAAAGTAAIGGSIAGGLLVQAAGWPWVFFLNVPLGATLIVLALTRIPPDAGRTDRTRLDPAGALTLTTGLATLAFGVHESVAGGWLSVHTIVPVLGGVALLAAFALIESHVRAPLIPLATLTRPTLAFANAAAGLLWASFLGLIYSATLFVQQVLHWSPLAAGASTVPIAVLSLGVSAVIAPRLITRIGAPPALALGMAIQALGLLLLLRVPAHAHYLSALAPAYSIVGIGLGLAQVAVQIAAFADVAADEAGLAGGALETAREMGGAVGLALLVSLAVGGATDLTDAFHRSMLGGAVFAGLGALVAGTLLHRANVRATTTDRGRSETLDPESPAPGTRTLT